jgi:hypothetical protein
MIYEDNKFEFHVPVEIKKSGNSNDGKMILGGIASTADRDREGEMLIPEGFDYNFLLKSGYINWHHQASKNPEAIIGEPTMAKLVKGGLYIEAELYRDSDMAQKAYSLAQVLNKNSQKRKLGWSIEGKVVERDPANPNRVTKARITGVALTHMPINPKTFVSICKSMVEDKALDHTKDYTATEAVQSTANGGKTKVITMGNKSVEVKKGIEDDDDIVITVKSLNTTSGAPIMPESLEGGTRPKIGSQPTGKKTEKIDSDDMVKGMDESEVYEYMFAAKPNLSISQAKEVMRKIRANKK